MTSRPSPQSYHVIPQVFVLGPRHDPRTIATQEHTIHGVNVHVGKVALGAVYLMMGGDLDVVPSVAAGN